MNAIDRLKMRKWDKIRYFVKTMKFRKKHGNIRHRKLKEQKTVMNI